MKTKMTKLALLTALSMTSIQAWADLPAVQSGTAEDGIAAAANDVFWEKTVEIGKYAYKVVAMDTHLNGDIGATTVVLVGEKAVGGLAGYDSAFILSPSSDAIYVTKVREKKGYLEITSVKPNDPQSKVTKKYKYDPATKTLKSY